MITTGLHNIQTWTQPEKAECQQRQDSAEAGQWVPSAEFVARFWSKVKKTSGCWLWMPPPDVYGYGQIAVGDRRVMKAHRVAWILTHGPIPDGLKVCHHCDNPPCVNPYGDKHLFLGTQGENLADAVTKGRLVFGRGARKLSDEAYREILAAKGYGVGRALAKKYGVTHTHISLIRNGKCGVTYLRSLSRSNDQKEEVA